jgi:hypothetical protein
MAPRASAARQSQFVSSRKGWSRSSKKVTMGSEKSSKEARKRGCPLLAPVTKVKAVIDETGEMCDEMRLCDGKNELTCDVSLAFF